MSRSTSLVVRYLAGLERQPDAPAVQGPEQALSHEQLWSRVSAMGSMLQAEFPLVGARIALCAKNHVNHLSAYLAILLAGHVWVPLNPLNGRVINESIIGRVRPDRILFDRDCATDAVSWPGAVLLDGYADNGIFEPRTRAESDVAAIKFTGGSTGEPKGVLQTHGNMVAAIENLNAFYSFSASDCNLVVAPMTHGSSHYLLPVLAAGGRHYFPSGPGAGEVLDALADGCTIAFMPPTLIYKLLREASSPSRDFKSLRHLTYSAAAMPPERIEAAQAVFGSCLSTLYGLTEAPLTITGLGPREMIDPELRGSVGRPCGSSEVEVVDGHGAVLPAGQVGEVRVKGPIVMAAYLDDTEHTQRAVRSGWLHTGDHGFLDDAGYLKLVGRASEMIISGGFNVFPAEVENALAAIPGVIESCVFGVPDEYWGERIEAAVVLSVDDALEDHAILDAVREAIGPVRTPKRLHRLAALPRNAVGKVVRADLVAQLSETGPAGLKG